MAAFRREFQLIRSGFVRRGQEKYPGCLPAAWHADSEPFLLQSLAAMKYRVHFIAAAPPPRYCQCLENQGTEYDVKHGRNNRFAPVLCRLKQNLT